MGQFWLEKTLDEMNQDEWEALCDGCGKCCLHKFIADDDVDEYVPSDHIEEGEEVVYTNIVCQLLNTKTCTCTQYSRRTELVPDCVQLSKDNLSSIFFMPPSCTYRRLQEGRGLPSWHPLLNNGKKSKMHSAGMSVRGKTVSDRDVDMYDFENYIVMWPLDETD